MTVGDGAGHGGQDEAQGGGVDVHQETRPQRRRKPNPKFYPVLSSEVSPYSELLFVFSLAIIPDV